MNRNQERWQRNKEGSSEFPHSALPVRRIAKLVSLLVIRAGVKDPKPVAVGSFFLVLAASTLIFVFGFENWLFVIVVSALLVVSSVLGLSVSRIAEDLKKRFLYDEWLDMYLKRIGGMVLYTVIGYQSWFYFDRSVYFILGICIGYMLSFSLLTRTLKKSVFLSEIKKEGYETHGINPRCSQERAGKQHGAISADVRGGRVAKFLGRVLFGVKISMDVWYLLTVVFILLRRTDIVLIFLSALFVVRSFAVTIYTVREIKVNEIGVT